MTILILYLPFLPSGILLQFHSGFIILVTEENEWGQKGTLILLTKTFWPIEDFSPCIVSAFSLPLFFRWVSLLLSFITSSISLGAVDAGTLICSLQCLCSPGDCTWEENQHTCSLSSNCACTLEDLVRTFYWLFATQSYKVWKQATHHDLVFLYRSYYTQLHEHENLD